MRVEIEFITESEEPIKCADQRCQNKSANAGGKQVAQQGDEGGLGIAAGIESCCDDSGQGEDKDRAELEQGGEHGATAGFAKIAGAEHALHVDLVHAPIEDPCRKRAEKDSDEGIIGIVVGLGDMHRKRHMSDECMPTANPGEADEEHQATAGDHDGGLHRVSVGDGCESADNGDYGDACAHEHHHGHHVPTQQAVQHESAGIQMERQLGHDADNEHKPGENDARGAIVAELEVFRNGVDTGADVVGEEHRAGNAKADASGEFDGAGGQAVAVRIARETNQVLGADVGGEE